MTWSHLNDPWTNIFEGQETNKCSLNHTEYNNDHQKSHSPVHIQWPAPQKSNYCENFWTESEFDDHHLEQAIVEMANKGELENFLEANTISLKDIQDDFDISYGKSSDDLSLAPKSRARRNSIGTADELVKCPYTGCNKIFNRSYNFKSHLKTHSAEKTFKCKSCPLSFARCHDLKRHEKIHDKSNHSLHKCDICHKHFSRSDALNRHIRLNTCIN